MAEEAKINIGCVIPGVVSGKYRIKGRNLVTGMPAWADIDAREMSEPLGEVAAAILDQIEDVLEETPPELIGDIHSDGIILTGGGAQLAGFDKLISRKTKLKVRIAENPSDCVITGCGEAIPYIDSRKKNQSGINPIMERY